MTDARRYFCPECHQWVQWGSPCLHHPYVAYSPSSKAEWPEPAEEKRGLVAYQAALQEELHRIEKRLHELET